MSSKFAKQGYLLKQGAQMFKTWQKRYFRLNDRELLYSKQNTDPESLWKKIKLSDVAYVAPAPECKKPFGFKICIKDVRIMYLVPDSHNDLITWIEAIEKWRNTKATDLEPIQLTDFSTSIREQHDWYSISIAVRTKTKQKYVLKSYQKSHFNQSDLEKIIQFHMQFIETMNPFVVPLRFIIQDDTTINFLYDYVSDDRLFSLLEEEGKFPEIQAAFYSSQIFYAIQYLHLHNSNCGFLNPNNIFVSSDGFLKIFPPGLEINRSLKNDLIYTAPEILLNPTDGFSKPNPNADFYAFGAIIYEMVCGLPLFFHTQIDQLKEIIKSGKHYFPFHVSQQAIAFINKLISLDPTKRTINFGTIKDEHFFKNIDWDQILTKQCDPKSFT